MSSDLLERPLAEGVEHKLQPGRAYLWQPQDPLDVFVPLWPIATAFSDSQGLWQPGLIKGLKGARFNFAAPRMKGQTLEVLPGDFERLIGAHSGLAAEEIPASLLAMEPYRGLRAYQEEHAALFFGRTSDTEELLHKIDRDGVADVVGASGSGKSSLVLAVHLKAGLFWIRIWFVSNRMSDHPREVRHGRLHEAVVTARASAALPRLVSAAAALRAGWSRREIV